MNTKSIILIAGYVVIGIVVGQSFNITCDCEKEFENRIQILREKARQDWYKPSKPNPVARNPF
jgi:hypothetical protein